MPKKRKIPSNFICKCGHPQDVHHSIAAPIYDTWCVADLSSEKYKYCDCNEFNPDNLKYLEQQFKKRNKRK